MFHLSASHDMQGCQMREMAENGIKDLVMQILDALITVRRLHTIRNNKLTKKVRFVKVGKLSTQDGIASTTFQEHASNDKL